MQSSMAVWLLCAAADFRGWPAGPPQPLTLTQAIRSSLTQGPVTHIAIVPRDEDIRGLEVSMEHAAAVDVVERMAQRLEEAHHSQFVQRLLAQPALEPVDQITACAEFHHDRDRAAAVVVPVKKNLLEADDVGVVEALEARRFSERSVRFVDRTAADYLEHIGLTLAHDQVRPTVATCPQLLADAELTLARSARAWLDILLPLLTSVEGGAGNHTAYEEG